jgi:hypothetical protein
LVEGGRGAENASFDVGEVRVSGDRVVLGRCAAGGLALAGGLGLADRRWAFR